MANQAPMWWMRGGHAPSSRPPQQRPPRLVPHVSPSPPPPPSPPPAPPPEKPLPPVPLPPQESVPPPPPRPMLPPAAAALADRLRHMDGETLLLLALLWLLWQEHADPKLLLALAYIAL